MVDFELVPCTIAHLEHLFAGNGAFQSTYGIEAIAGYLPFEGALAYTLKQFQAGEVYAPWLPYLFVLKEAAIPRLVGFGGFKSPPVEHTVEIGALLNNGMISLDFERGFGIPVFNSSLESATPKLATLLHPAIKIKA